MSNLTFTKSGPGTMNDPEQGDEVILGSGMTKDDLEVTILWLNDIAGAAPALGYNSANHSWVVAPTCRCPQCKEFTDQYQLAGATNPLRAVRLYLDAWNAYEALRAKSRGLH